MIVGEVGHPVPSARRRPWPTQSLDAQLAVIPDAGHSPQFEKPDAWFAALHGFLGALVATAELTMDAHGGRLAVEVLRAHGVDVMFTLSGGHLFVLYDGAVQADLRLVDTRHEQTATFAAEGWAKVTRRSGARRSPRDPASPTV